MSCSVPNPVSSYPETQTATNGYHNKALVSDIQHEIHIATWWLDTRVSQDYSHSGFEHMGLCTISITSTASRTTYERTVLLEHHIIQYRRLIVILTRLESLMGHTKYLPQCHLEAINQRHRAFALAIIWR